MNDGSAFIQVKTGRCWNIQVSDYLVLILATFSLADYSYQLTSALSAAVRKARDEAELDTNN